MFAHVKDDFYIDIGTQVQSLAYIIDKSLATKCYKAKMETFWCREACEPNAI